MDAAGRVERFKQKYGGNSKAAKAAKGSGGADKAEAATETAGA